MARTEIINGFMVMDSEGGLQVQTFDKEKKHALDNAEHSYMVDWKTLSGEGFEIKEVELTITIKQ